MPACPLHPARHCAGAPDARHPFHPTLPAAMKWTIITIYVLSILHIHFRGRVRLPFVRQLFDHSSFMAPINIFMHLFSGRAEHALHAVQPASRSCTPLQENWEMIRDEALNLIELQKIKAAAEERRRRLQFLLQDRLEALLPEVVRRQPPVGGEAVPEDRGAAAQHPDREGRDVRRTAARRQAQPPPRPVRRFAALPPGPGHAQRRPLLHRCRRPALQLARRRGA